jgi:release factor glutamine methyltransferase
MTIDQWLDQATQELKQSGIPSYRLDAELLLADVLEHSRVYLHAHGPDELTMQQLAIANVLLRRRAERLPIAYILGFKEFYGRSFAVSPEVLIPRPETETLIELLPDRPKCSMIDVGTGSGAIAITAKLEHPDWIVSACDIDEDALLIAAQNADRLGAHIAFRHSDLLASVEGTFDIIAANLPYVDREWERSPETGYEPELALFADDHGLALIRKLLQQAPAHLDEHGHVLLEADPEQHSDIIYAAQQNNLQHIRTEGYITCFQKM